jgi:hypothetical protein
MKANYIIRAGEPLSLDLLVQEGDVTDITQVSAVLKKAGPNLSVPPVSSPILASFEISELESPDIGWNFYLDDSVTLTLPAGYYITNARIDLVSGGPLQTDPVTIEVRGAVTA